MYFKEQKRNAKKKVLLQGGVQGIFPMTRGLCFGMDLQTPPKPGVTPSCTRRVHLGVLRLLSCGFTERLLGAPAPMCLVGSMENGSQNTREICSQSAAKPFVTGSETNDRTALHGQAAPGWEKKPPTTKTQLRLDSNTNQTPALIIGQLQPGW